MSEALFGALVSSVFVAALWFNYHGFIPSTDTSQQKDKTEQTDESSKDKSEQKAKSDKTDKGSSKKASKKKTSACATNCPDDWQFHPMMHWPNNELQ
jgi:hypothetical protein